MRKRSTKEILQLVEVSYTDPLALSGSGDAPSKKPKTPEERKAEREAEIAAQRKRDSERKDNESAAKIDKYKSSTSLDRAREDQIKQDNIRKAELAKAKGRKRALEGQAKKVNSRENLRKTIAGGKPSLEKITRKDGSATATGKAAANLVKTGASLVRKTAAIPANIAKQKAKAKLGRMQMDDGRPPDSGTLRQKVGYGAREAGKDIRKTGRNTVRRTNINVEKAKRTAVNIRRKAGRGIEKFGSGMSKIGNKISEDFIREAEKNDKKKKETIDVMKGTNKVEVNPKMQAEAKKMTKKQIKKRDEIADAISTREMNKRYGDKNVKYAIATKLAMKKEDVTLQDANGNDFVQIVDLIKPEPLVKARSVQEISECWKTHKQVGYKKKGGRMVPNCVPKNEEKEPTKGLMKLAATVAANNKKRKNALQIQKYIGEDKKMGRQSDEDLSAARDKFSKMDQSMPSNQFMLKRINKEINRRKKANPKPDVTTEGTIVEKQGGDKKNPDSRINYRANYTQDRELNSNPDLENFERRQRSKLENQREEKRKRIEKKKEQHRKKRQGDPS